MAQLNLKEKLIREAAKGKDPFLSLVYKRFVNHFKAESHTPKKVHNDCFYIDYLYRQNHNGKTFKKIADDIFHIGLSTLEERRAIYVSIFYFYLADEQKLQDAAVTKNN